MVCGVPRGLANRNLPTYATSARNDREIQYKHNKKQRGVGISSENFPPTKRAQKSACPTYAV